MQYTSPDDVLGETYDPVEVPRGLKVLLGSGDGVCAVLSCLHRMLRGVFTAPRLYLLPMLRARQEGQSAARDRFLPLCCCCCSSKQGMHVA